MASVPSGAAAPRSTLGTLVVVVLVVVLAWQLAYWTWVFVAPPATASAPRAANDVDLAAVARLFGAAPPAADGTAASTSGLRLKGVVAPTPGTAASAIFSTGGGRDLSVFIDREVQPGVKLAEVHADHVIVSRAGIPERIDLDTRRSTAASSAQAPAPRQGAFRLNVAKNGPYSYALSRKELDDALRDPNQLGYLGQVGMPPGGGVRMEQAPAGSLAAKLGLQPGDIIRKVNGQAVAGMGDLARLYTQFNTISTITVDVQRGGEQLQLSYSIQQ
jgi:general secretion pathway protein C